jgi:transcription elongation factor GreA
MDPVSATPDPGGEPITAEGLEALKRELHQLETKGRREIAQRILIARGYGDLKENAEYHAAKEDQAHLETRIKRLQSRLRSAVVTDVPSGGDTLAFGRTAEIVDEASGAVNVWTIVGPTEADVGQGKLSAQSPIGQSLLNQPVGETVEVPTPRGTRRLRIQRLV